MKIYIISRKLEVGHTQYFPHQTFHVEQLQTEEAAENSFSDISEVQRVGSEGANTVKGVSQRPNNFNISKPNPLITPHIIQQKCE